MSAVTVEQSKWQWMHEGGIPTFYRKRDGMDGLVREWVSPFAGASLHRYHEVYDGSVESVEDSLVIERLSVSHVEVLVCGLPFAHGSGYALVPLWVWCLNRDEGIDGWSLYETGAVDAVWDEYEGSDDIALTPWQRVEFPLPIRAGDAIALIEGGDFR